MKLTNSLRTFVCVTGVVGMMVASTAQAQYTQIAKTNTISGVTSNWVGTYSIGNALNSDGLIVNGGGVLNSSAGLLGNTSNDTNNFAQVSGSGSTWANAGTLTVGVSGSTNRLSIASGGFVVDNLGIVGAGGNGKNAVLVTDSGSTWSNLSGVYVGISAPMNTLTITSGGVVYSGGSSFIGYVPGGNGDSAKNNSVVVTGTGSIWTNTGNLYAGYVGTANSLTINNGGKVMDSAGYVGVFASNTAVTVTGSGSRWDNAGVLNIGLINGSFNSVAVSNGAAVTTGGGVSIGSASASGKNSVTVGGSGAYLTAGGSIYVGESGPNNSLAVNDGGTVSAPSVYVGLNTSSTGNILTVTNGTLNALNAGAGVLDVRRGTFTMLPGSTVNVDQFTAANGNSSIVVFKGGTLNTKSTTVNNGTNGVFKVGDGLSLAVLNLVNNGTHTFANGVQISANASLTGNGTIVGDVTSAGNIGPGNSPGILNINRNLTLQTPSVLNLQIGGPNQGTDYDVINVTGSVALGGMLQISLINGYTPLQELGYIVLQGNSPLGGTFTNVIGGLVMSQGGEGYFTVEYNRNNDVRVSGFTAIPEPSTCLLAVIGLVGVVATRRARGRRS